MSLPTPLLFLCCLLRPALPAATPAPSIREGLEAFVKNGSLSGAVAIVDQNHQILREGAVGYRDPKAQDPMAVAECLRTAEILLC